MARTIFVNLHVNDLKKSMAFFKKLGFTFNPKFTNHEAACMEISENIFSMLVVRPRFKEFIKETKKSISDSHKTTECMLAITCKNKAEVDKMAKTALSSGGKPANQLTDLGWMYSWSFQDLDGHIWEPFFMDEKKAPKQAPKKK